MQPHFYKNIWVYLYKLLEVRGEHLYCCDSIMVRDVGTPCFCYADHVLFSEVADQESDTREQEEMPLFINY